MINDLKVDIKEDESKNSILDIKDAQRRQFIKMLGVAGIGAFAYSLIPKRAHALVFGSEKKTAIQGSIKIKNKKGRAINPATDGGLRDIKDAVENVNKTSQSVAGMNIPQHDYLAVAYPNSTSEVYTYKVGGSSGSVVATLTVTYADSSKDHLVSVSKN